MAPSHATCGGLLEYVSPQTLLLHPLILLQRAVPGGEARVGLVRRRRIPVLPRPVPFPAAVSVKLAERCSGACNLYLNVRNDASRIFLAWLLHRDIDELSWSQRDLAKAWNFGAEYDIPAFQDAVMRKLIHCLQSNVMEPDAVLEAYHTRKRGTPLQAAFIAQLAYDMRRGEVYAWDRSNFTEHGMENVPGFFLDLTEAMCPVGGAANECLPGPELASLLLMDTSK